MAVFYIPFPEWAESTIAKAIWFPWSPVHRTNRQAISFLCLQFPPWSPNWSKEPSKRTLCIDSDGRMSHSLIFSIRTTWYSFFQVECAFFTHIKGTYTNPKQFNYENCWKPLTDFLNNLNKVKEEEWALILQFDSTDSDDGSESKDMLQADQSMISAFRAGSYLCSSPVKAWQNLFSSKPISDVSFPPIFNYTVSYISYFQATYFTAFFNCFTSVT